jgi:integrase
VARSRTRRTFGSVRRLPSGRYQARYVDPEGRTRSAPTTFDTKMDADAYLSSVRTDLARGSWVSATNPRVAIRFGSFAQAWLADRSLKPRTRHDYERLFERFLLPAFGEQNLSAITPTDVRAWHAGMDRTTPTLRAHAYALLRTLMGTALADGLIAQNPCTVRGASVARRVKQIRPATLDELATVVAAMPDSQRLLVLFAAWCSLRFGELVALTRSDIDMGRGVVRISRGVTRVPGKAPIVGVPKSDAGTREVHIPPHLLPVVRRHLAAHVGVDPEALLFPARHGGYLAPSALYRPFYKARLEAGRPDLRFHDLRHTGAVLSAQTGATLADLMARLGHSTASAAMRYQHSAAERDLTVAQRLSDLAAADPRPSQ